jgi:hypothetical protein
MVTICLPKPAPLLVLASAILLAGCSKPVDLTKLDGQWRCTEWSNGEQRMASAMTFRGGEFGWTLPTESPAITVLVRARYTVDGATISMPQLYTNTIGIPFAHPGWSPSERSIVTGIEELTDTKLVLAPWKASSSERKLKDNRVRYECERPAPGPRTIERSGDTAEPVPTNQAGPDRTEAAAPAPQAPASATRIDEPPPPAAPSALMIVVRLPLPSDPREQTQVGVLLQPRTQDDLDALDGSVAKIKQISRTILGRALRTPGTVLIGNRELADQLLAELRRQLDGDFIESLSLDEPDV